MAKYKKFKKKHYFDNQKTVVDGIPINPTLRWDFDITPNDDRENIELENWWDKPYICVDILEQEPWIEHSIRLKNECGWDNEKIGTKEDWEKNLEDSRKSWFETWHTGFRYEVRCLDGGAWDRSTNYGMYATFEEALEVAKQLKE